MRVAEQKNPLHINNIPAEKRALTHIFSPSLSCQAVINRRCWDVHVYRQIATALIENYWFSRLLILGRLNWEMGSAVEGLPRWWKRLPTQKFRFFSFFFLFFLSSAFRRVPVSPHGRIVQYRLRPIAFRRCQKVSGQEKRKRWEEKKETTESIRFHDYIGFCNIIADHLNGKTLKIDFV